MTIDTLPPSLKPVPLSVGVHRGIPAERYHASDLTPSPALTAGMAISLIQYGPARAWVWRNKQHERSDAMDFGCAAHIAALEPHLLQDRVVIVDAPNWQKKAARAIRDEARANGQFPILAEVYAKLEVMGQAMRNQLDVPFDTAPGISHEVFDGGAGEVTLVANAGGIWMKARPDYLKTGPDGDVMVDYKTTNLSGGNWSREAARRRCDLRAAFYCDVYRRSAGRQASYWYLVQEFEWPHFVYGYVIGAEDFRRGAAHAAGARAMYARCMADDDWPSDVGTMRVINPIS